MTINKDLPNSLAELRESGASFVVLCDETEETISVFQELQKVGFNLGSYGRYMVTGVTEIPHWGFGEFKCPFYRERDFNVEATRNRATVDGRFRYEIEFEDFAELCDDLNSASIEIDVMELYG